MTPIQHARLELILAGAGFIVLLGAVRLATVTGSSSAWMVGGAAGVLVLGAVGRLIRLRQPPSMLPQPRHREA